MKYIPIPKPLPSKQEIIALMKLYPKISYETAVLLLQRGLDTKEKIQKFFHPSTSNLLDPFLMPNMKKAIDRIIRAISNKEKILLYGDYDVDGTTSIIMAYSFFSKTFPENQIGYYIPTRNKEGYGVSIQGIDYAKENDYSLIITFDCGISDIEPVNYAKEKGIDVIITDHHNPPPQLPDAYTIINPKLPESKYPYKHLSGCAVGFKLIQAFAQTHNIEFNKLYEYLDIVAISIASDIVPLTGENRLLCQLGLEKLNNNPSPALQKLKELSVPQDKKVTIENITFGIGPRINAAGRMQHASIVIEAFYNNDMEAITSLNQMNDQRKSQQHSIEKDILENFTEKIQSKNAAIVYGENWHKGIIGIVASKIVERFFKPTVVLTRDEYGKISGSARTVNDFDLYYALSKCKHCFEKFGGHQAAAGFTLKPNHLQKFEECFENAVEQTITQQQKQPKLEYDLELKDFDPLTEYFNKIIQSFAPFGPENPEPLFYIKNIKAHPHHTKPVGKNNTHLKLYLSDGKNYFNAIAFNQANIYPDVIKYPINIIFSLQENIWKGISQLQLNVKLIEIEK